MARFLLIAIGALMAIVVAHRWTREQFVPEMVEGRRVLVTGASSGIGEEMAYQYARMGASVFITARRESRLQRVIEKCRQLGPKTAKYGYVAADMSNAAHTKTVIKAALKALGGLDHLMLNHALIVPPGYWNSTAEELDRLTYVMETNFLSFVHLVSNAMPHLAESRGNIGVVSSMAGKISTPLMTSYAASKFALEGFFDGFRQEQVMKNTGVSATLIYYGTIGTEKALKEITDSPLGWVVRDGVPPASTSDAAIAAIEATSLGEPELYFPALYKIVHVLRTLGLKDLAEWNLRRMHNAYNS